MKIFRKIVFIALVMLGLSFVTSESPVFASGTGAGTTITNQATVYYSTPSDGNLSSTSNVANFLVDEIVRVNAVWQDAAEASVIPDSTNQYMSLTLTNTGNGTEAVTLSIDTALGSDQFDPTFVGFFRDSNNNGIYEPSADISPADSLVLTADQSVRVFVVNDIPLDRSDSTPLQDGDTGQFTITINSNHGSGPAGTIFPGDGDKGGTAIFGRDFPLLVNGQYMIVTLDVDINKSATIEDSSGGNLPYSGATITYTLTVNASGSGTAYNLTVTDPIPAGTTYITESLTLDGTQQTDADDGDSGVASGTPVKLITVNLGDQNKGTRTISFKVLIDE